MSMTSFRLKIVTPDGLFFDGQAEKVRVRTIDGDVCILARHLDYATALGMGKASITIDGKVRHAACIGGMLSVTGGEVSLIATTFEWADEIDMQRAQRAKENAEMCLSRQSQLDKQQIMLAQARLKRALVRLNAGE